MTSKVTISVDVMNEKGEKTVTSKVMLPSRYEEFVEDKEQAFQFFMLNIPTKDQFEVGDFHMPGTRHKTLPYCTG